ncbi:MAG: AAA family ATPase [Bryobacteraceae bacterium]
MVLRRLAVEHFQCFTRRTLLGPLDERINILHGPNGSGKSTLLRALVKTLFESHRATGKQVESLRPRGRQLAPRAWVEFSHAGQVYRATKQFLDQPWARLERWEASAWTPLADADAAVEQVRKMLRAGERDWGIAGALWTPQGSVALPELSGDALADIRRSLGAQLSGPAGQRIEAMAEALYAQFFTSTGRVRTGRFEPEFIRLGTAVEAAREEVAEARTALVSIERSTRQIEQFRSEWSAAEKRMTGARSKLATAEKSSQAYTANEQRLRELEIERRAADAEYHRQNDLVERLRSLADRTGRLRARLVDLAVEVRQASERIEAHRQAKERATEELFQVSSAEPEVRRAETQAADAERYRQVIDDDKNRLRMEWSPEAPQTIRVKEGEPAGEHRIGAGQPFRVAGAPRIELEVEGVGKLRATGLGESVTAILEAHADWATSPPDAADLRKEATRLREEFELKIRRAQDRISAAGHELSRAESDWRWLAREQQQRQEDLAGAEAERDRLSAGSTPEERQKSLDNAALVAHGVESALKQLREEIGPVPGAGGVRGLQREAERAEQEAGRLRDRWIEEQALLRSASTAAPHERLSEAEERLAEFERAFGEEKLHAEAAKLLWETIEACRDRTLAGLSKPVEAAATTILERVADSAQPVRLTEEFEATGVGDFAVEELSGGETEQVHLAVRLALADLLAAGGRQLVVLDDVLTATDSARMERIVELLRERSARLQFLVLTCHPERYRALTEAKFFDVEKLP